MNRFRHGAFTAVILLFCVLASLRNTVWHDDVKLWADVVEKSPNRYRGYFQLGNAYLSEGKFDQAEDVYRFLERRETRIDSVAYRGAIHEHLGVIMIQQGNYDAALEELRTAATINPANPVIRLNLGIAYERKGRYRDAITAYEDAISINPSLSDAWYGIGLALVSLGEPERARQFFEKTLSIQPLHEGARRGLALTAQRMQSQ